MGFLSKLFNSDSGEDPESIVTDPVLGSMHWRRESKAWDGEYNNFKFQIAYSGSKLPAPTIIAHAREILNDPDWISKTLADAKTKEKSNWISTTRDKRENRMIAETLLEIDALTIAGIVFHDKQRICFVLGTDNEGRCWYMNCKGRNCLGFTCDD